MTMYFVAPLSLISLIFGEPFLCIKLKEYPRYDILFRGSRTSATYNKWLILSRLSQYFSNFVFIDKPMFLFF
ncbi:hypothetical protein HanIR_Chr05g0217381 [Helianthus annuus]|nr:hypothetical protein HanIR_Chr05g0217381 [Helianthus annuus]